MNSSKNPFRPVKFEDEERPLLYVSEDAMEQFKRGNFYFTGKRGCGKTTCLKVADTEFQLNDTTNNQEFYRDIAEETFGVYISLNNRIIPNFYKMTSGSNKALAKSDGAKEQLTAEFLELTILRAIVHSLSRLQTRLRLRLEVKDEESICAELVKSYHLAPADNIDVMLFIIGQRLISLIDASRGIGPAIEFRSRLEIAFNSPIELMISALRRTNKISQMRILIDDGEVFDWQYQRALNTLIRSPRNLALSWSVAYVNGKFDPKTTTINNQPLGREERTVVYLDSQADHKYANFASEVIRLRVERAIGPDVKFDIADKLGSFDTNELARASFEGTTSENALKFVARAAANSKGEVPAFYEQHLRDRNIQEDNLTRPAARRKNVASYISLCRHYGVKPRYAGERVVSALSDGCIRDYLETMAAIFDAAKRRSESVESFFNGGVLAIEVQDEGCRDASERKLTSIMDFTERSGFLLEKLVRFLGNLVYTIQTSRSSSLDSLKNPERAVFGIGLNDLKSDSREMQLIKDGEVDGYLRHVMDVNTPQKRRSYYFRLHRQFCPKFNISYRESYDYVFNLRAHHLRAIMSPETEDEKAWAEHVYRQWEARKGQGPSLFDDEDA